MEGARDRVLPVTRARHTEDCTAERLFRMTDHRNAKTSFKKKGRRHSNHILL